MLMAAEYASDYQSADAAATWDKATGWKAKKVNCITSANFFLGYMLQKGGNGYKPAATDNLVKASATGTGFSDHYNVLKPAFSPADTVTVQKLHASKSSSYAGADRWPYWDMPFGMTKSTTCKCGLHVSPKFVLDGRGKLPRVSVASVSLASGTKVGGATEWWRSWDQDASTPFDLSKFKLRWEYTVMLVFHVDGDLYVYHHTPAAKDRWRTFRAQAEEYVNAASPPRMQDSLWLLWGLPDEVWQKQNPTFFQDDDGSEWTPNKAP
jgi:hypothetical protein